MDTNNLLRVLQAINNITFIVLITYNLIKGAMFIICSIYETDMPHYPLLKIQSEIWYRVLGIVILVNVIILAVIINSNASN